MAEGEVRAGGRVRKVPVEPAGQVVFAALGSWLTTPRRPPASCLHPQVAACADGRSAVNEYDCLLLEFVLGQRPDDAHVSTALLAAAAVLCARGCSLGWG